MRRIELYSLLALILASLSACGAPATVGDPTLLPEPSVPPTAAAAEPTASAPSPTQATTRVQVKLADNTIASSLTTFQAGVTYTFVVTNSGRHEHNFNISPPVSVSGSISSALDAALLSLDETQLPPGGTASIDFTFPVTAVGAELELNCLIRRHYDDGMRIEITVTD